MATDTKAAAENVQAPKGETHANDLFALGADKVTAGELSKRIMLFAMQAEPGKDPKPEGVRALYRALHSPEIRSFVLAMPDDETRDHVFHQRLPGDSTLEQILSPVVGTGKERWQAVRVIMTRCVQRLSKKEA